MAWEGGKWSAHNAMAAVGIWTQSGSQAGQQDVIPLEFFENYRVNYTHHPMGHGMHRKHPIHREGAQ